MEWYKKFIEWHLTRVTDETSQGSFFWRITVENGSRSDGISNIHNKIERMITTLEGVTVHVHSTTGVNTHNFTDTALLFNLICFYDILHNSHKHLQKLLTLTPMALILNKIYVYVKKNSDVAGMINIIFYIIVSVSRFGHICHLKRIRLLWIC